MEIEKLIDEWCGNDIDFARGFKELFYYDKRHAKSWTGFVEWLSTKNFCGKEQRKFLDEIEELHTHSIDPGNLRADSEDIIIYGGDFDSDLEKVIKENNKCFGKRS